MSTATLARLRSELLTLSEPERAELAYELIQSLDAPADEAVEEAWDREIVHRIKQIDSGQAKLLDRKAFREKVRASFYLCSSKRGSI